jgi:hypothetical protein
MGVYSINNENAEIDMNSDTFIECTLEPGIEAAYNIVVESEENYNRIIQAVGIEELAVFESTGAEMVYEGSTMGGFIEKAKQLFINMWEKIKGVFKKFFAMFDSFVSSDKDFVNKYKKHLLTVNTRDFKYQGYEFKNLEESVAAVDSRVSGVAMRACGLTSLADAKSLTSSTTKTEMSSDKMDDKSDILEEMRGAAFSSSKGKLEAGEYTKELFEYFRNGESSKSELATINVSTLLTHISANSGLKKEAEKTFKDVEKTYKETIKALDAIQKEVLKLVPNKGDANATTASAGVIKSVHNVISLTQSAKGVTQLYNGAKLTALKDLNRQSKAICVSLMNYKPKNESVSYEEGTSFLSGVVLK